MDIPRPKKRTCTLCGAAFVLTGPAMANPADLLCNPCIRALWADPRPDAEIAADCVARISPDLGLDPKHVATGMIHRMHDLRSMARSADELEQILGQRR